MNSIVRNLQIDRDVPVLDFKSAMRSLAGGVSIITVGRGDDISGMTVTSVSSLSVEPPTLIVSVNRGSSSWPLLQRYGAFGINIVGSDQLDVAERFSGKGGLKGAARFAGAKWTAGITGTPLLVGALAALDCVVEEAIERHSHAIVIGHVRSVLTAPGSAGLAYWDGRYAAIDNGADARKLAEVSLPTMRGLWEI